MGTKKVCFSFFYFAYFTLSFYDPPNGTTTKKWRKKLEEFQMQMQIHINKYAYAYASVCIPDTSVGHKTIEIRFYFEQRNKLRRRVNAWHSSNKEIQQYLTPTSFEVLLIFRCLRLSSIWDFASIKLRVIFLFWAKIVAIKSKKAYRTLWQQLGLTNKNTKKIYFCNFGSLSARFRLRYCK